MALRHLKKLRVAVAILVFAPAALMFVDFGSVVPARVAGFIGRIQLVPSLLRGIETPTALVPVVLIALSALLFGRAYCSTLCPLGTLQDLVIRVSTTRRRRRRFRHARSSAAIHVAILAAVSLFAAGGAMFALGLTEPFSNFGRILATLGRPIWAGAVTGLSLLLGKLGVYGTVSTQSVNVSGLAVSLSLAWLAGIVALSYAKGRLFCNLLCPTGALLRLVARFSAFKLAIDERNCTKCGLCEKVCKARCIDSGGGRIDFTACVSCFNCLDVCPTKGIAYRSSLHRRRSESPNVNGARREWLQGAILLAGSALVQAAPALAKGARSPSKEPITPPGSRSLDHFTSHCTACHLCVGVCPTQVLRPALFEYGVGGMLQPRMVYERAACGYDCNACGQVCPTGAIEEIPIEEKQVDRIGVARFVTERCVVTQKRTACGACAEHCPTKAVSMVPFEDALTIPRVNEDLCIGCGACEHPCPVRPQRAIFVEARSPHGVAMRFQPEESQKPFDSEADFPF